MKQIIRLTESDLHMIVKKSVSRILREAKFNPRGRINLGADIRRQELEKQARMDDKKDKKKEKQAQQQQAQNKEGKDYVFKVEREVQPPLNFDGVMKSIHYLKDRSERDKIVLQNDLRNAGEPLCAFQVDKEHKKGKEMHTITDKAIVVCQNYQTALLATIKPAIPDEIKAYWEELGKPLPEVVGNSATNYYVDFDELIAAAEYNEEHGLNKIKG